MARIGIVLAGVVLALIGALLLSLMFHWFPAGLLLTGIVAIGVGLLPQGAASSPAPAATGTELRVLLAELDALHEDGVVSAEEHGRKRQELLDAWGRP